MPHSALASSAPSLPPAATPDGRTARSKACSAARLLRRGRDDDPRARTGAARADQTLEVNVIKATPLGVETVGIGGALD